MYSILFLWSRKVQSVLRNINGFLSKLESKDLHSSYHLSGILQWAFLYPNKARYEIVISRKLTLNTRNSHRIVFTSNLYHQCLFTPCISRLSNLTFAFIFQFLTLGVDKCVHKLNLTAIDHRNHLLSF